jgi:uncharacterized membrane protein
VILMKIIMIIIIIIIIIIFFFKMNIMHSFKIRSDPARRVDSDLESGRVEEKIGEEKSG